MLSLGLISVFIRLYESMRKRSSHCSRHHPARKTGSVPGRNGQNWFTAFFVCLPLGFFFLAKMRAYNSTNTHTYTHTHTQTREQGNHQMRANTDMGNRRIDVSHTCTSCCGMPSTEWKKSYDDVFFCPNRDSSTPPKPLVLPTIISVCARLDQSVC